jgi:hypothetical protein
MRVYRFAAALVAVTLAVPAAPAMAASSGTMPTTPPFVPQSRTTVTPLPNDAASAPAAVKAEAATVRTEADLARVSPAARALFQTAVDVESKVTVKPALAALASRLNGAEYLWPGCWNVQSTSYRRNIFAIDLADVTVQINNWCFGVNLYGYWVIWSQPWWRWWASGHWGEAYCGLAGAFAGWLALWWEYGAGVTALFGLGGCYYWGESRLGVTDFVYGNGLWLNY